MTGSLEDPVDDSAKLDRILAQLTMINACLDSHEKRIARTEKFRAGENPEETTTEESRPETQPRPKDSGGGGGGGGGGSGNGNGSGPYRGRPNSRDDGAGRGPRQPKLPSPSSMVNATHCPG